MSSGVVGVETGAAAPAAPVRIALCGNPNTGKSTLFNRLAGAQAKVGNYPGVTVDLMGGRLVLPDHGVAELVDIPGSYSLLARSAEEQIAVDMLLGLHGRPRPDVVVACVDATNLIRNLHFVLQLQEHSLNVVVALTMVDEAEGHVPSAAELGALLSCHVVPVCAHRNEGIAELHAALDRALQAPSAVETFRFELGEALSRDVAKVRAALPADLPNTRAMALWALMSWDPEVPGVPTQVRAAIDGAEVPGEQIDDEVIGGRYGFLDANVQPLVSGSPERRWTRRLDGVFMHPVYGFGVFLLVMFVLFQSLFAWADPAIGWVEEAFGWMASVAAEHLPAGVLGDLFVEGIIGGVGSVVVFLPQILLLFLLIGALEDSGYMSRVAYLMDRIMRLLGLNGRAFVPMLSGFACAIPAIMATRTMEQRRDRFLTMMVVPLMTCSARLPVYTLIIAGLFPAATVMGFLPLQGLLMVAMYVFSVLMALGSAFVLSKTVLKAAPVPLVMELPPYRLPRPRDVLRMMWQRARFFLSEAGTVILVCSIVLWGLLNFPRVNAEPGLVDAGQSQKVAPPIAESYGGQVGRFLEPAIEPLGFDWKIGVGLFGAFAAREVFVATMGIVYNIGEDVDEESVTLRERMRQEVRKDGTPVYSGLTGLSLMVFFALACQCVSTIAVVKRETNSYRWPLFLFAYMTSLAWCMSLVVYQGGRMLGF